ncbi:pectate lyase superfamily protein-domain-containing protein [Hypoxylon crocopeplum]|nr:pectate lyase superfamily protein-domain-containing protein [Hypoxylon crocopeplum]
MISRKLSRALGVLLGTTLAFAQWSEIQEQWTTSSVTGRIQPFSEVFRREPPISPEYMVDNTDNKRGVAPINGEYNGPVWQYSGSFENYMKKLQEEKASGLFNGSSSDASNSSAHIRRAGGYWLPELAKLGKAPHAGDGYVFYRNVVDDYHADRSGEEDSAEAINAAIQDGDRCGEECGNTFVKGAVIYFPPGTYKICTPIIQLYYTQFISDPNDRAIIKGCDKFTGIALVDVDPYVPNVAQPDGTGVNWYINQNQFFRQIRNFVFDLMDMPSATDEHGQKLVPTGIHWQVSQATSLQNLLFKMPTVSGDGGNVTHVGIFTENGSGGFVSDLEFEGGAIGWRVGSQQYTAIGLRFKNCITAVQMIWDWGFNWQNIEVEGGTVAFNISGRGGIDGQGIGSVSIIDSTISNTPIGVLTNGHETMAPNIVIDNTVFNNVGAIVQVDNGDVLLPGGSQTVGLWAHGRRYKGGEGLFETGDVDGHPSKPDALLDGGKLVTRLRPQYEDLDSSSFLVATEHGCTNDATGDNTDAINSFLQQALAAGKVAYFPAGIYPIQGTVTIPTGSRVQGTSWSQIQATGSYFQDMANPKVAVRVGEDGDVGTMEIVEMLFTVKGSTPGAIMVEWNVKASSPGAAGLWDSHIRIGGGIGTDLDVANCPKFSYSEACITVSLLLHVTEKASGYFENMWAWVADHDNDMSLYWEVDSTASQISLYGARGVLIESQGPTWLYGTGSEHTVLYQYQTYKAKDVYLGHIQTESPYFQPDPVAPTPFESSVGLFPGDPDFESCTTDSCKEAWGLRVIDSEGVTVHSAGLYSWFVNYGQDCLDPEDCQARIMQVEGSKAVAIYNIFTKGVTEIATGEGYNISVEDNQRGYTAEISVWYPQDGNPGDDLEVVYIGTEVYTTHTAQCTSAGCIMVIAPSPLQSPTTITIDPYETSLEVGHTTTIGGVTTFIVTTTTITITIDPITTDKIPVSNVNVTSGATSGSTFQPEASIDLPPQNVSLTNQDGQVTTRIINLPPWPQIINGAPESWNGTMTYDDPSATETNTLPTITATASTYTHPPYVLACPPSTFYIEEEDATITLDACSTGVTTLDWSCPATETVSIDADSSVDFTLGCTRWTGTTEVLPTYTEWPPGTLEFVDDGEDDDDDNTTTCRLWFFWICISWGNIHIGGWRWRFPRGVLPPGPPPPPSIKWPPGITVTGNLPGPWPRITIGPSGSVTYPTNQPESCTTETAEICSTLTSYGITVSDGTTVTTATATVSSTCTSIFGCNVEDDDGGETTSEVDSCTLDLARRTALAEPTATAVTAHTDDELHGRAQKRADVPPQAGRDHAIIFPRDPFAVGPIKSFLTTHRGASGEEAYSVRAKQISTSFLKTRNSAGEIIPSPQPVEITAFFFVKNMLQCHIDQLNSRAYVAEAYGQYQHNKLHYQGKDPESDDDDDVESDAFALDEIQIESANTTIQKRTPVDLITQRDIWQLSQIAVPPNFSWKIKARKPFFRYTADDSFGEGQRIYICEDDILAEHSEFGTAVEIIDDIDGRTLSSFARTAIRRTTPFDYGSPEHQGPALNGHGTAVTSKTFGAKLGLAKKAEIVVVRNFNGDPPDKNNMIQERYLESLIQVLNDIKDTGEESRGKFIVNMSWGWANHESHAYMKQAHYDILYILLRELDLKGVVLICAAHNDYYSKSQRDRIEGWPGRFGDPSATSQKLDNLIVVGGTDIQTRISPTSPWTDWLVVAPSWQVHVAWRRSTEDIAVKDGNSLGAPMVCALVAYWRGLQGVEAGWKEELKEPANVKKLLRFMHREIAPKNIPMNLVTNLMTYPPKQRKPFVWTGWYEGGNCLETPDPEKGCPEGPLSDLTPGGSCPVAKRQVGGGSCQLPGSSGGDVGDPISYQPGSASPTCNANCGTLCTGYYCTPDPTGLPPGYYDPKDPAHPPPTTTSGSPGNGGTTPPPTSSSTLSLPPLESDPYSGPECSSYTTSRVCNGSGGQSACVTQALCVPTKPCPPAFTASGTPICSKTDEICLSTTVNTRCARGSPTDTLVARVVTKAPPRAEPTATPTAAPAFVAEVVDHKREAKDQGPAAPRPGWARVAADQEQGVSPRGTHNDLLFPRQNGCGGSANGGCDYLRFCALCATVEKVPCLEASIHAITGALSGTDVQATVIEDGEEVCAAGITCALWDDDCSGIEDFDCGGGNSMGWRWNYIQYTSAKYGTTFPMYLDRTVTDDIVFCWQDLLLRVLPAACIVDDFAYKDGPCRSLDRRAGLGGRGWAGDESSAWNVTGGTMAEMV